MLVCTVVLILKNRKTHTKADNIAVDNNCIGVLVC